MTGFTHGVTRTLEDVLEEVKQSSGKRPGNYAVSCFFGEDVGCDDLDMPQRQRTIEIQAWPIGFLGEVRRTWKGKLHEVLTVDLNVIPTVLPNPPGRRPDGLGSYVWGVKKTVDDYMERIS